MEGNIRRERRGPGRLHGKSVSCPTGLILLKSIYICDSMSPERDLEDLKELREWFRALPPDEIVNFVKTLPQENRRIIKHLAHDWAAHRRPKSAWWQYREDSMGRKYYQNRMTEETHWAAPTPRESDRRQRKPSWFQSTFGESGGAPEACTGNPYHVELD